MDATTTTPEGCARGSWQRGIVLDMQSRHGCYNPVSALAGRAKQESSSYQRSFEALLGRLRAAGFEIRVELGPRGGMTAARWYLA